eukprot:scaffold1367_cov209-Skeletonema_marinoi.AAC.5
MPAYLLQEFLMSNPTKMKLAQRSEATPPYSNILVRGMPGLIVLGWSNEVLILCCLLLRLPIPNYTTEHHSKVRSKWPIQSNAQSDKTNS